MPIISKWFLHTQNKVWVNIEQNLCTNSLQTMPWPIYINLPSDMETYPLIGATLRIFHQHYKSPIFTQTQTFLMETPMTLCVIGKMYPHLWLATFPNWVYNIQIMENIDLPQWIDLQIQHFITQTPYRQYYTYISLLRKKKARIKVPRPTQSPRIYFSLENPPIVDEYPFKQQQLVQFKDTRDKL